MPLKDSSWGRSLGGNRAIFIGGSGWTWRIGDGPAAASVQNKLISRPIEWASSAMEQVHLQTMPVESWRGNKTEETQKNSTYRIHNSSDCFRQMGANTFTFISPMHFTTLEDIAFRYISLLPLKVEALATKRLQYITITLEEGLM